MTRPEPNILDFDRALFERRVSASILRLRSVSPFFATLTLFAHIAPRLDLPTAATNGRDIWISPFFADTLSPAQLDGLILHEVLHAALGHVLRRGERDPLAWNVAADIVVNGIVARENGLSLPPGALRDAQLESLSAEEVYELLQHDIARLPPLSCLDLLEGLGHEEGVGPLSEERRAVLETYWRHAREQALLMARSLGRGDLPPGLKREWGALEAAQLDWRSHLWRFLVRTPVDFQGFDRRYVGRGLYLEALEGETLRVRVAVDTSGSISSAQMGRFLSEVRGILLSYPHIRCELFYADAALYGPYSLEANQEMPQPEGGGGTSFVPFFEALTREAAPEGEGFCVYLTDGFGTFPTEPSPWPTLWVVAPGGLASEEFPWGEVARLLG